MLKTPSERAGGLGGVWDVRAAATTGHHLAVLTDEIRLRFFPSVCGEAGTAWDTCLPCDSSMSVFMNHRSCGSTRLAFPSWTPR